MLQTKINIIANGFEKHYMVTTIDDTVVRQAKAVFDKYHNSWVILNKSFSDNTWKLTNQIITVSFNFEFSRIKYYKNTESWIGCSYACFQECIKTFIILKLGSISLLGIQDLVRDFHAFLEYSHEQIVYEKIDSTETVLELLRQLSFACDTRDAVIEVMEERISLKRKGKRQRVLANFSTYFAFHDTMQSFWNNAADEIKLQYFPLRMWWTLTSILPLRPTEFLLTPRKCVECENDEWILTIRRTTLKGGYRKKTYRINDDYELRKYVITQSMAQEILDYLDLTKDMLQSKLDTLFVQEPHNALVGQNIMKENRYYSYANLSTCLKKFQDQFMGMLKDNGNLINLGDTRHIAMINLIISGNSPVICKELAGHNDINISSHYYSNISKFIECATYETYRKSMGGTVKMRNHRSKNLKDSAVKINGGYCDSPKYREDSIEDCIKHMGSGGEIGYCPECPHFIDEKHGMYIVFANPEERKKQVDEDSELLLEALDSVRKGIGCNEDIQAALLRLQYSSTWYSRCLQNELEVNKNGETT